MSDYTAAYTELVDKVIGGGGGHDHAHHHHDNDHDGDHNLHHFDVVTKSTLGDGGLLRPGDADSVFSDIMIAKATAMSVLFVAALCAGLIPFKLAQWFKWKQTSIETGRTGLVVSLLLAFGGGVLLCTTFLHLLPEVKENVERLQASGALPRVGFHLAEFLMCVGFFTMYFIEQCVHEYLGRDQRRKTAEQAFRRGVSVRESASVGAAAAAVAVAARRKKISEQRNGSISIAELIENDANANPEGGISGSGKYLSAVEIVPKLENIAVHQHHQHQHGGHHSHGHGHGHGHSHLHLPIGGGADKPDADGSGGDDAVVTSLRGLLIVLALSVHELFEGLAVGLEGSAANVWYLFGAVAAHKLVLAFCVGVELIVARTQKWLAFSYVLTFSVVSPLGIGIGILVSSSADGEAEGAGGVVSAVLQGLASGTLLYVVFFEILQKDKSGLVQLVAVLVGFFIMFGLQFMSGHEHTHGGDGGHSHTHPHSHAAHTADTQHTAAMDEHYGHAHADHHHDDPAMTTAESSLRALPQLVTDLADAVLAQTETGALRRSDPN